MKKLVVEVDLEQTEGNPEIAIHALYRVVEAIANSTGGEIDLRSRQNGAPFGGDAVFRGQLAPYMQYVVVDEPMTTNLRGDWPVRAVKKAGATEWANVKKEDLQ